MCRKLIVAFSLALSVLFALSCNNVDPREDLAVTDISIALEKSIAELTLLENASERYARANVFGSTNASATEYVIKTSLSQTINEYGVFKAASEDDARLLCKDINLSLDVRRERWDDRYYSDEKPKLDAARAESFGRYVVYGVLYPTELEKLFENTKSLIYSTEKTNER